MRRHIIFLRLEDVFLLSALLTTSHCKEAPTFTACNFRVIVIAEFLCFLNAELSAALEEGDLHNSKAAWARSTKSNGSLEPR